MGKWPWNVGNRVVGKKIVGGRVGRASEMDMRGGRGSGFVAGGWRDVEFGLARVRQSAGSASSPFPIPAAFGKAGLKSKPDARGLLGQLPLIFEPNEGRQIPG